MHNKAGFECTQCSSIFRTHSQLRRHERIHWPADAHPFRCVLDQCTKSCYRADHMRQHLRRFHKVTTDRLPQVLESCKHENRIASPSSITSSPRHSPVINRHQPRATTVQLQLQAPVTTTPAIGNVVGQPPAVEATLTAPAPLAPLDDLVREIAAQLHTGSESLLGSDFESASSLDDIDVHTLLTASEETLGAGFASLASSATPPALPTGNAWSHIDDVWSESFLSSALDSAVAAPSASFTAGTQSSDFKSMAQLQALDQVLGALTSYTDNTVLA
ncbi:uncharacterized protein MONBRDRAFT_33124 [Monosiga brevicollis MX1]|uniref:C2H2-type domain-containing protein n=1 Tax=Monosiga brevicollis TaxID=81824 RepID=A9V3U8_MONBE|nr:uncharacterized protein MONBRDRAFT_33124 [Monosiga brevicollis MX1]EDQ87771.1 predicted protein [Monosiga brevicollis MX1]|eukprot:XP_001747304.1 hypothetical protein [Monosiga brevicollis MX1]